MAVNAIGIVALSGDNADAFPAPALAIQHSPCGMYFGFNNEARSKSRCLAICLSILVANPLPLERNVNRVICAGSHCLHMLDQSQSEHQFTLSKLRIRAER